MFLLNSRLGLFVETYCTLCSINCSRDRHLFSRSYEAILPSSLMIIISTPEHSQPVYLCRFAVRSHTKLVRGFSSQCRISWIHKATRAKHTCHISRVVVQRFFQSNTSKYFAWQSKIQVNLPYCVTPSLKRLSVVQEYLTCCPSPTPIGLGLGVD